MTPKISVVIPVYNGVPFLNKAIDSVLAQTYPVHEIIAIDDGSTDGSPAVLDSYQGKIIRKRIPNSGISEARNTGMALAKGDYIAFIDQDDVWFKTKLAKHVEYITRYPEVGFFSSNYAVRSSHDGRLTKHFSGLTITKEMNFNEPLRGDPFEILLKENFVGTPSAFMVSRKLFDQVGWFSTRYAYTQDYDYQLRCARVGSFLVLSDVLLYKRTHPGNFSANQIELNEENKKLLRHTALAQKTYIRERHLEPVYKKAMSDMDFLLGNQLFQLGKRGSAFKYYFMAFSSNPSFSSFAMFCLKSLRRTARILISLFRQKKLS